MTAIALLNPMTHFARNGKSFHFASRFLPSSERERIGAVYSYCRLTDDLVDEADDRSPGALHQRLDEWLDRSRRAYAGQSSGVPVVDRVMADMRETGVPFRYVNELIAGMRMDVSPAEFRDFIQLRIYTYRVAGVVGVWLTRLYGIDDPWMLERAATLGHAMQLTNIVRDVGDDWRRGRVYLPTSLMQSYGLTRDALGAMYRGDHPVTPAYRAAMEALMATADVHYCAAFEAMPLLPATFRRSVAIAAEVYRGIHAEVRRAGYDTISRRARTTLRQKVLLGARGLGRLRAAAAA
jgi:phytoene synthase